MCTVSHAAAGSQGCRSGHSMAGVLELTTVRKVLTLLSSLFLPSAGSRSPNSPLLQLQTFSGARKVPAHSFCVVSVVTCVCSSKIGHLSMSAK